jgi:hypothetical protein
LVFAVTALMSCRSPDGLSDEARKMKRERYETVYTVGSHIPRTVRRGEDPESNNGASPVAVMEGERAREAVRVMQPRP